MEKRLILLTMYLLYSFSILAQSSKMTETPLSMFDGKRKALLIGNKNYQFYRPLSNTERDVDAMSKVLKNLGFEVSSYKNLDYQATVIALRKFKETLSPNDVALLYYSGHGIGSNTQSYLLPVDASIKCTDELEVFVPISLNKIIKDLEQKQVRNSFVFLDACRNLPNLSACSNAKDAQDPKGLVMPKTNPRGNLIVFATGEGNTADDDTYDKTNSLFTAELIKNLQTPNVGIRTILDSVTNTVEERSNGKQIPQKLENLRGDFVFAITKEHPNIPDPLAPTSKKFMDLPFAEMAFIKGGTFQMGDTRNEGKNDEKPVHKVMINDFWMGKYEVTQRQWEDIMGTAQSSFKDCSVCPVESVSWNDVQDFLKKLNQKTGLSYRLPTEAEWEYAAGGGAETRTRFGNGQDILKPTEANFDGSSIYKTDYSVAGEYRVKTSKVGSFSANRLGLFDMTGNVWEWCQDWYGTYTADSQQNPTGVSTGSFRVLRGGGWINAPQNSRVAYRSNYAPGNRYFYIGFRVVSSQ